MSDSVPPGRRLERAELERVILRAAQLQAGSRELEDGLSEDEVLKLGADVGIPAPYLRQALMEERMRATVPAERGLAAYLAGPRLMVAERAVPGSAQQVMAALELWMAEGELLIVKRRFADQVTWEPRRGTMASLKRSFRLGGREYYLARTREVAAQVSSIEANRTYVRLAADVGNIRNGRLGGATALATAGIGATGVLLVLGFAAPIAALAVPVAALGAVALARVHRQEAERVQVALEQVLDKLERKEIQPPDGTRRRTGAAGLEWIADEIRRSLQR